MRSKLLPFIFFAGLIAIAALIWHNPPQSQQKAPIREHKITVETQTIQALPYQFILHSYGTVAPRTQSTLIAQVGGKVTSISPRLRNGGFFVAGDVLVEIDRRDYMASVRNAQANLVAAQLALTEEQAASEQAQEDWQRLGNTTKPPELVIRKPQLLAAQAKLDAAQSALSLAKLNLERTRISAPYDGRVLNKHVDVGQVVSTSTPLCDIYATDTIEVRLPLQNRDLAHINLPEHNTPELNLPHAIITSTLIRPETWPAQIVRTEGAIDRTTQQLYVVAQIEQPFGQAHKDKQPLKIGEYVTAKVYGNRAEQAIVIPNAAIYQGSYVYVVEDGVLRRKEIEIAWQNDVEAVIATGLRSAEQLVITTLGQVTSGTKVAIRDSRS